jgi:membrane protease YdiL (CAAX protease family)
LFLTFALSWGYDLLIARTIGHRTFLALGLAPWSMFVPAAVAFALQLFFVRDSPLHLSQWPDRALLIPVSFLTATLLYAIIILLAIVVPGQRNLFGGLGNLLTTLWTLAIFALYGQLGERGFCRAGLPLGNRSYGFRIALGVVAFLLIQFGLNLLSGLGTFPGMHEQLYGIPIPGGLYPVALLMAFGLAITGTPLAGLAPTFGEEYGWRGILQNAWAGYGPRNAALLVGLVWGLWHIPVIVAGIHTYPATGGGLLLALIFFSLWGMVQSYAVFKTGSIWVAAFLHGLVNSLYAFGLAYLVQPQDKIWSFGLGFFGLWCLALIALLLLRDPVWQQALPTSASQPGQQDHPHRSNPETS